MSMSIEEKLAVNKIYVDEGNAHITTRERPRSLADMDKLIKGCPAGLYHLHGDGTIRFDFAGCLECGTCRVLAPDTVLVTWNHPQGTMGVEFRYG